MWVLIGSALANAHNVYPHAFEKAIEIIVNASIRPSVSVHHAVSF